MSIVRLYTGQDDQTLMGSQPRLSVTIPLAD
jgi:hypothetical protein